MDKILFDNVLPQAFSHITGLASDVWGQAVEFQKGHLYLLESDSGKGKSTFCSYVVGYRYDYTGEIRFDNRSVLAMRMAEWVEVRRCHVTYLFQELRLFPELTAYENVEIKNQLTGFKTAAQIKKWFEQLGIADKIDTKIALMSFGQQQRVALIRALVQPFDFLLADEPISHLDDGNSGLMGELIMEEAKRQGAGVIITSIGKHIDMDYERVLRL